MTPKTPPRPVVRAVRFPAHLLPSFAHPRQPTSQIFHIRLTAPLRALKAFSATLTPLLADKAAAQRGHARLEATALAAPAAGSRRGLLVIMRLLLGRIVRRLLLVLHALGGVLLVALRRAVCGLRVLRVAPALVVALVRHDMMYSALLECLLGGTDTGTATRSLFFIYLF